jgi:hypothetical protein
MVISGLINLAVAGRMFRPLMIDRFMGRAQIVIQ